MLQGRLLIVSSPQSTTALQLGRLLNGSKQNSKKLCEATTTPLHTNGNMKWLCRFLPRYASLCRHHVSVCVCVCLSYLGIITYTTLLVSSPNAQVSA